MIQYSNFTNRPFTYTKGQCDLFQLFRMLWEQHSVWTRAAIVSLVFDLPDQEATINRLLRNPKDFQAVFTPYFGEINASKFEELLTKHLVLAADIVQASKAGDMQAASQAEKMWYANGDAIAALLGQINPFWSEEQWKRMMKEHLDLVKAEATYMLTGQYQEGVAICDALEHQALEMADMMADGIMRRFKIR